MKLTKTERRFINELDRADQAAKLRHLHPGYSAHPKPGATLEMSDRAYLVSTDGSFRRTVLTK